MCIFSRIAIDHCVLTSFFEFENLFNFRKQHIAHFGWVDSKKMSKHNDSAENPHFMLWPDQFKKNSSNQGMTLYNKPGFQPKNICCFPGQICKVSSLNFFLSNHGETHWILISQLGHLLDGKNGADTEGYPVANTRRFTNARKIQCSVIVKVS